MSEKDSNKYKVILSNDIILFIFSFIRIFSDGFPLIRFIFDNEKEYIKKKIYIIYILIFVNALNFTINYLRIILILFLAKNTHLNIKLVKSLEKKQVKK